MKKYPSGREIDMVRCPLAIPALEEVVVDNTQLSDSSKSSLRINSPSPSISTGVGDGRVVGVGSGVSVGGNQIVVAVGVKVGSGVNVGNGVGG